MCSAADGTTRNEAGKRWDHEQRLRAVTGRTVPEIVCSTRIRSAGIRSISARGKALRILFNGLCP